MDNKTNKYFAVLNPMTGQYTDLETIEEATELIVDIMLEFIPDEYATLLLTQNPMSDKPNVMYDYFMIHTHNSPIAMIQLTENKSRTWFSFNIITVKENTLKLLKTKLTN
jgi:hypothetical protein